MKIWKKWKLKKMNFKENVKSLNLVHSCMKNFSKKYKLLKNNFLRPSIRSPKLKTNNLRSTGGFPEKAIGKYVSNKNSFILLEPKKPSCNTISGLIPGFCTNIKKDQKKSKKSRKFKYFCCTFDAVTLTNLSS